MTLLQERLRTTKDLITDRGADNTTAGTLSDVSTTGTSFLRFTLATVINSFAGGVTGKHLTIVNANGVGISIVNNSGGTAVNRILTGTGANIVLASGASIDLRYDDAASRWRVVGSVSATGDVTGPASATNGSVAVWDGTTGKLLRNGTKLESLLVSHTSGLVAANSFPVYFDTSGTALTQLLGTGIPRLSAGVVSLATDVVTGPASATDSRVAVYDGTTGKLLKNGTKLESDLVTGPATATDGRVAVYDGTTGKLLQNGTKSEALLVSHSSGAVVAGAFPVYSDTSGTILTQFIGTGYIRLTSSVPSVAATIPAADIAGATDAAAVAAGRIGETINSAVVETSTTGSSNLTLATLALTAGKWLVTFSGAITNAGGTITTCDWSVALTTNIALVPGATDYYNSFPLAVGANGYVAAGNQVRGQSSSSTYLSLTTSTTYYLRGIVTVAGGGTVAIKGTARAVRVG